MVEDGLFCTWSKNREFACSRPITFFWKATFSAWSSSISCVRDATSTDCKGNSRFASADEMDAGLGSVTQVTVYGEFQL